MIRKSFLLVSLVALAGCVVPMLRESPLLGAPKKFERVALVIRPGVMDQKAVAPDLNILGATVKDQLAEESVASQFFISQKADADSKEFSEDASAMQATHTVRLSATQHATARNHDSVQWLIQVDQAHEEGASHGFAPMYKMTFVAPHCQKAMWGDDGQERCHRDWTKSVLATLRSKGF